MTKKQIDALRARMKELSIDYYLVPSSDAHQSEYLPACWERRSFISGFTGSAGDVLVGLNEAYLWTDGRYFAQAELELDMTQFTLMKQTQGMAAPIDIWMRDHTSGKVVAVDPAVVTVSQAQKMKSAVEASGGTMSFPEANLIDALMEVSMLPKGPVTFQSLEWAGQSAADKIAGCRVALCQNKADAMVVNSLDTIAWLLNIRGSDIEFNPLVLSYVLLTEKAVTWFVDASKCQDEQVQFLREQGIDIAPYDDFYRALNLQKGIVWLDPSCANYAMFLALQDASVHQAQLPTELEKACKNSAEIAGAIIAHQKDGIALAKFFCWLEQNWDGLDEYQAAEALLGFRQQSDDLRGQSFNTISGYGPNGAVIHYAVKPESALPLSDDNLYLLDSGGQYVQGTTDITRVFHFGSPTAEQKRHYTLVLKGHLALKNATFVKGNCGYHLDALARQYLWADGLDFMHGTGHGVGSYLCVHEGPQRISPAPIQQPLLPGMIVSNEPGLYIPEKHGIRIENLMWVVEKAEQDVHGIGVGPFYGFEDLTLVPYNAKLIETSLLSEQEIAWINDYHEQVFETLSPSLNDEEAQWLAHQTTTLSL